MTYDELKELAALYVGERKMINCDNYGRFFNTVPKNELLFFNANKTIRNLSDYEGLNVELSDKSYSIEIAETMNEYSSQAKRARALNSSLEDGYTEEMLGINYSNIVQYHNSFDKPGKKKDRENIF